jgi:hypothetical protein
MEYEDFELQIGPQTQEGLLVRVQSPAGKGEEWVRLPSFSGDLEILSGTLRHLEAEEAQGLPTTPAKIGSDLFQFLFIGQIGILFHESLSSLRGLRIRLWINPRDRTLAPLLSLPWELLYRKDREEFLALHEETPIVRGLDVPRPATIRPYQSPLRILAVLARDPGSSPLKLDEELKQLREALQRNPEIQLETLEDPNIQTIRNVLGEGGFHILHYMGHGAFEPDSGDGALLFRGPAGRLPVTGRHLATKVTGLNALRLVILNACETAVVRGEAARGPFAGVAAALVLGGIPAVVAMQSSIRDSHALAFTSGFYRRLADGMPLEEAVTEGRQEIHSDAPDAASWAAPVLFLRGKGDLFPQSRERAPEPQVASPPLPARKGTRGLLTRALLLGLLAVALGAGLISRFGDKFSGSRGGDKSASPATQPISDSENPGPAQHPPSPQQIESPPPSPPKVAPVKDCGLGLQLTGTLPAGFFQALCKEAKRLASAFPVAGRTAQVEVGPARCSPSEEEGVSGTSCTIEALISLRGGGGSRELPPISVESWQPNASNARGKAAEKLVPAVVARIATSL